MSQDVFQLRMDAILEQCPGVIGIHDDMVIFGVDQQDHDANLIYLLNICQKEGLVLNSKKLELRRERVTFFRVEYSAQGMHPDPKKVQGITEMTAPMDKQQLQSFLGMVNYMGTFIPNLSHHTEPLRAMLKKDNVFHWDDQQTRSFQQVKTLIAKANTTPLRYYDRNLPVTVQGRHFSQGARSLPDTATQWKGPANRLYQQEPHGRCPARASQEIKLDMRVDYIAFTKPWSEKLKDSMQRDPILATVYQLTQQGWPHQRRHVPHLARRYWDFRDELSTDDGMLLKGPRLIIPGELQEEYLSRLHEGHLSASKVQENAKQHMY